jgi:NtrC-family two-component system response regulator AlgB
MADSLSQVRVLVVDDDPPIRTAITATLKAEGADVVAVASGSGALEACRRNAFDAVILDQRIGDQTGLELLPLLLAEAPWMKVVVVTAFASFELAVQAMQRGACNFLPKPFTAEQLRVMVGEAVRQRRMEQRLAERSGVDQPVDFSSTDATMSAAVELARQAAATDATVLICGETGHGQGGTGKSDSPMERAGGAAIWDGLLSVTIC